MKNTENLFAIQAKRKLKIVWYYTIRFASEKKNWREKKKKWMDSGTILSENMEAKVTEVCPIEAGSLSVWWIV